MKGDVKVTIRVTIPDADDSIEIVTTREGWAGGHEDPLEAAAEEAVKRARAAAHVTWSDHISDAPS